MLGVVKWFSSAGQSYGYITREDGIDVFCHYKNLTEVGQKDTRYRTLVTGQTVEFEISEGHYNSGTQAINVKVLSDARDNQDPE